MQIDIRAASLSDAAIISALNREVQSKHVDALPWLFKDRDLGDEAAAALLTGERNLVRLASVDSTPAGYIYAEFRRFPETPLTHSFLALHIHHIAVVKSVRRGGIGRALMEEVIAAGKRQRVDRLTADYWAFNDEATVFFARFGLESYIQRVWSDIG
jgi:GNAT superfamily N-acetyltransferase